MALMTRALGQLRTCLLGMSHKVAATTVGMTTTCINLSFTMLALVLNGMLWPSSGTFLSASLTIFALPKVTLFDKFVGRQAHPSYLCVAVQILIKSLALLATTFLSSKKAPI